MDEKFPGEDIDKYLDTFTKEYDEHTALYESKDALHALITQAQIPMSEEALSDIAIKMQDTFDKYIDLFIQRSHSILSRPYKHIAVEEWVKFIVALDESQQKKAFMLTGQDLLPPLELSKLPHYAWSYIKQQNLDLFDEYNLERRTDLDDEEWIEHGFMGRELRRIDEIFDYWPDGVAEAFRSTHDSKDLQKDEIEDRGDDYVGVNITNLGMISERIKAEIHGLDYGPAIRYLDMYRHFYEQSAVYKAYMQKAGYISRIVQANNDSEPRNASRPTQSCYILHEKAFMDGFLFAMIVNNHILNSSSERFDMSTLDHLAPQTHSLMEGVIEIAESGDNVDTILYEYGIDLFNDNLAHPEEPNAKEINKLPNPLNALAETVATDLYNLVSNSGDDENTAHQDAHDFYAGFGIGRTIYNAHRMDMIRQLEQLHAEAE